MEKKDIVKRRKGEVIYEAKIDGQPSRMSKENVVLLIAAIAFSMFFFLILIFS